MVPNVVKGSGFRGLCNYLLVGRQRAVVVGGNMVGRSALELAREFGMIRRLRPGPTKPVMHHTLSFGDAEDPGDQLIAEIAASYVRRMGLEDHQWVAIVHRDKAHVHVHLAINRISIAGAWWNATHDFERSQVVAAQVEREFGLIEPPRQRLRTVIANAIATAQITPPAGPPAPPTPVAGVKHVLGQIRGLLEEIPHGISVPEWVQAVEEKGLHLRPSIGAEKVSGFTVRMPGHRAVKLADVHRSLSWPKLLASGRVIYDPEVHFAFISSMRQKEVTDASPTSPAAAPEARTSDDGRAFDSEHQQWLWEWQPTVAARVDASVVQSPGPDTPAADLGTPTLDPGLGPESAPGFDPPAAGGIGASRRGKSRAASPGIRGYAEATEPVSYEHDIELLPEPPGGPDEHLLGGRAERGSRGGSEGDDGIHAALPIAGTERPSGATQAIREPAQPLGGNLPRGSSQTGARSRRQGPPGGDLGWRGVHRDAGALTGARVDFEDLGRSINLIPARIRQAAKMVVALEEQRRLSRHELDRRVLVRESLWEESQTASLTPEAYRLAKASLLGLQQHLGVARAVIRDLTVAAKQGAPFDPTSLDRYGLSGPGDGVALPARISGNTTHKRRGP